MGTQAVPMWVRLVGQPMIQGERAWPAVDRPAREAQLRHALAEISGQEGVDAVFPAAGLANALFQLLGSGQWSLRQGGQEIGGRF